MLYLPSHPTGADDNRKSNTRRCHLLSGNGRSSDLHLHPLSKRASRKIVSVRSVGI